ncbi:DUF945 family protein [Marinimicrobium alkaliphilum]|uniref:DUF945 family protein n=1 Tax=Marinimicrobium alkaliphilum TaxID=2202654 RepID=UPI000DBA75C5|nr:DUF945 family protein [Marinimicrobium alkaliphilum]
MKKFIGTLVVLVLVYVTAAYATGYLGEREVRQQLLSEAEFLAGQQVAISLEDYRRGITSSEVTTVIRYRDVLPEGELVLTVDARVSHGPLFWQGGAPRLGLSSIEGEFRLHAPDQPELNAVLERLWGESLGTFTGYTGFTGRYTLDWQIPGFDQSLDTDDARFSFAGAQGRLSGVANEHQYSGDVSVGAVTIEDQQGSGERIEISGLQSTFDLHYLNAYISVGEVEVDISRIAWQQLEGSTGELTDVRLRAESEAVGDKLNSQLSIDASRLEGVMLPVRDIYYRFALNNVSQAALTQWQASASQWGNDVTEAEIIEVMDALLQPGLQFSADMGAGLMDGQSRLTLNADYIGLGAGRSLSQLDSYGDLLAAVNAELVFRADDAIVMNTPLILVTADYIGTYLIDEGGEYVMRAKLQDGRLTIADIPFPIEFLLMGLM